MRTDALRVLLFVGIVFAAATSSAAQVPSVRGGVHLYKNGDYKAAVKALEDSNDLEEILYLGLAYEKLGKKNSAGKAFDRAFKKGYHLVEEAIRDWLKENRDGGLSGTNLSVRLKSLASTISVASESATHSYDLKTPTMETFEWTAKGRFLEEVDRILKKGEFIYGQGEVDTPAKVISSGSTDTGDFGNPNAPTGSVVFLALLASNGEIFLAPLDLLDSDRADHAYVIMMRTTFTPAKIGEKPVTTLAKAIFKYI